MQKEELQDRITSCFPECKQENTGQWLQLTLAADDWPAAARLLKTDPILTMDYLFCLTCIDWKTKLSMVYHLSSTQHRQCLVIKIDLDREKPVIESVAGLWRTAEFHEREVYELFGVQFNQHPDLRLLILPDGWEGRNPMRKDFDDPVNMIRL